MWIGVKVFWFKNNYIKVPSRRIVEFAFRMMRFREMIEPSAAQAPGKWGKVRPVNGLVAHQRIDIHRFKKLRFFIFRRYPVPDFIEGNQHHTG
jgi:hypothetical protein